MFVHFIHEMNELIVCTDTDPNTGKVVVALFSGILVISGILVVAG